MLSFNVYVGDALLHAIRKEVVGAVELLLNHKKPSGGMQVLGTRGPGTGAWGLGARGTRGPGTGAWGLGGRGTRGPGTGEWRTRDEGTRG